MGKFGEQMDYQVDDSEVGVKDGRIEGDIMRDGGENTVSLDSYVSCEKEVVQKIAEVDINKMEESSKFENAGNYDRSKNDQVQVCLHTVKADTCILVTVILRNRMTGSS